MTTASAGDSRPGRPAAPSGLPRVLGLADLIAIVLGTVIGSGIFMVPGVVLRDVGGHLGLALGVWVAGGVLSLLGALTYGELGALLPEAGGLYVYIRDAFGPLPAFLYGWTQFLVIASGSVATLAVAFTVYLGTLTPIGAGTGRLVAVGLIAICAAINVWGTRKSADMQAWTTAAKALAILVMGVALLLVPSAAGPSLSPASAGMSTGAMLAGAGVAVVATMWSYEGWQYVTFAAGEARNPQRTFARGLVVGTCGVVFLYVLANVAYAHALGPAAVAHSDRVAGDAVSAVFGGWAGRIMTVVVEIAVFSALNSVILTAPRVFYAMARDGLFFRRLAEVHPRFGTPAFAIIAGALWAMLLAASGTYEQLLTYVIGTGWAFYGLAAATLFWYRRHRPNAVRPFRVPGYPVVPALFVLASLGVVIESLVAQPVRATIGLGIALLGVPAYFAWRLRSGRGAGRVPDAGAALPDSGAEVAARTPPV